MSAVSGTVTLSTPITLRMRASGGVETEESVTELVLRRPLARDMLVTDAHDGEAAKSLALFAYLAGVPIETIDQLRKADLAAVAAKIEALKAEDWAEGSTSSLELREMIARDLRVTDRHRGEVAKQIALVATLAGVDDSTVQALPLGEFEALSATLEGPTPPGQPTGQTASAS